MATSEIAVKRIDAIAVDSNGRQRASGGFSVSIFEKHLRDHATTNTWCDMYCLARFIYGRASEDNRNKLRSRVGRGSRELLSRGLLLLKQLTGRYGSIEKFKLYDRTNKDDHSFALKQREDMESRGEATADTLQQIDLIMGFLVPAQTAPDE